jgi:Ca-activated chloride channel family protein
VARPAETARGGDSAYALLTLTPPQLPKRALPRDVIILLDTSGSMSGAPLEQAKRVLLALLDSLTDDDQLELIEFSNAPRRWKTGPVPATLAHRQKAASWLRGLRADGGTEMGSGVLAALTPLRADAQRQVVLVTDGLIGAEEEILRMLLERLPRGCRFHTVGVGSAANRALTAATARAGRGVELLVGLDEDAERVAHRLVAHTAAPLVTDLTVEGDALLQLAPERAPDLYAAAPALVSARVRPQGGSLRICGQTQNGELTMEVQVPPCEPGEGNGALAALFAREAVEDWELRHAAGQRAEETDAAIERLGLTFQISTRLTSWVAVSDEVSVDATRPSRREKVPQMLPYGMAIEGLGLRAPSALPASASRQLQSSFALAAGAMANSLEQLPSAAPVPVARAKAPSKLLAKKRLEEPTPVRKLRGKIRRRSGQWIWVELTVEAAELDWRPAALAMLELTGLGAVSVRVDLAQSTAPTMAVPGLVLRLALELPEGMGENAMPVLLRLNVSGHETEIAL